MRLRKMLVTLGVLVIVPASLTAQTDPIAHLKAVLPPAVATQVIPIVQDAIAKGLPGNAVANVALQGVAMGRSGGQVRAAVESMVATLRAAHDALAAGGRAPTSQETQAGAIAMKEGVDGSTVSALAKAAPSGRSLAVPLAVIGALVSRGLPADNALEAVEQRLQAHSSDQQLAQLPDAAGQMLSRGMKPSEVGTALGSARSGMTVPASGVSVPAGAGPPAGVPANGGVSGRRPTSLPAAAGSHPHGGGGGHGGGL